MELKLFGISHKTANLEMRESFVINDDHYSYMQNLLETKFAGEIDSIFVLSTCNRTEVYSYCKGEDSHQQFFKSIYKYLGCELDITENFYQLSGIAAFMHMCSVASGIESRIIGEKEIFGQFKKANELFLNIGLNKRMLSMYTEAAIKIAKQVRSNTKIDHNPVSISSLVLNVFAEIFENPLEQNIITIGAGVVASGVLNSLVNAGFQNLTFANRTPKKISLGNNISLSSRPLSKLDHLLVGQDIIISSISTDLPFIGKGLIEKISAHRKNKPLVIIDLGVPRNAESSIKNIEQVYLFSLEDIESFSNENLRARESEAEKAKVLINDLCSSNDEGLKEKVSRKELYSALTKLIQGSTEDFKTKLLNSNDPIKALNEINDAEIKLPKNINDIESYALRSMIREIIDVA